MMGERKAASVPSQEGRPLPAVSGNRDGSRLSRPTPVESLDALQRQIDQAHGVGPIMVPPGRDVELITFTGWKCDITKLICGDRRLCPDSIARVGVSLVMSFVNQRTYSAWPKQETLAAAAGVSVSTVKKAIKALIAAGYIRQVRRKANRSNEYVFQQKLHLIAALACME